MEFFLPDFFEMDLHLPDYSEKEIGIIESADSIARRQYLSDLEAVIAPCHVHQSGEYNHQFFSPTLTDVKCNMSMKKK